MSDGTYTGSLSGLSGADSTCLTELQNNPWLGKADAQTRGLLTASKVKAFLCDETTCQDATPNKVYKFARVNNLASGGDSFTATAAGLGPDDNANWSASTKFGVAADYWTGRPSSGNTLWQSAAGSAAYTCTSWSSTSGTGRIGNSNQTATSRFSMTSPACSVAHRLICFVHP